MLGRAIQSVLNQSYKNWELIIILDSCENDSIEIVKKFKDNRISFFSFNNLGGGEARNKGIGFAKGNYISFLDDDDEYTPQKLQIQIEFLKKHQEYCLVSTNFERVSNGKLYRKDRSGIVTIQMQLFENVLGSFSFVMVEKKKLAGLLVNKYLKSCQDWDFWVQVLALNKKNGYIIKDYLSIYDDHNALRISNDQQARNQGYKLFVLVNKKKFSKIHKLYHRIHLENIRMESKHFKVFDCLKLMGIRLILFFKIRRFSLNEFYYIVLFPIRENFFIRSIVKLGIKILR